MYIKEADVATTKLRFEVGTRVECNCGGWEPGTIVKVFYRQSSFPPGTVAPYQIRLDNGKLIYAPIDEDRVVRVYLDVYQEVDEFDDLDDEVPEEKKLAVTVRAASPAPLPWLRAGDGGWSEDGRMTAAVGRDPQRCSAGAPAPPGRCSLASLERARRRSSTTS